MRGIRLAVVTAMLLLLVPAFADSAGDQKSAAQPASDIPKGYEKLFGELADLMKKYPGAAERFHILDTKGTPTPTKGTPTRQGWLVPRLLRMVVLIAAVHVRAAVPRIGGRLTRR